MYGATRDLFEAKLPIRGTAAESVAVFLGGILVTPMPPVAVIDCYILQIAQRTIPRCLDDTVPQPIRVGIVNIGRIS